MADKRRPRIDTHTNIKQADIREQKRKTDRPDRLKQTERDKEW